MPNTAGPIDPTNSPKWALAGRIVTMDPKSTIVMDGAIWIADAAIAAITKRGDPTPDGFGGVVPLETGGTVFPGLIELHNHVAYNALPLWNVPKRYTNRNQWGNAPAYHQLVTAPMKTIGEATDLLPALVRYVECKALVGGVTTTQGIALFSAPSVRRYYRGIVRNVEETGDKALPEAGSRIADVDAKDPQAFLAEIEKKTCFLLHLSEGTDTAAHQHFEALALPGDKWAIAPSLAGIHCVALAPADFAVMATHGASMVWSPLSNLLLYGQTANVAAALAAGAPGAAVRDRARVRLVDKRQQEPVRGAQGRTRLQPEQRERVRRRADHPAGHDRRRRDPRLGAGPRLARGRQARRPGRRRGPERRRAADPAVRRRRALRPAGGDQRHPALRHAGDAWSPTVPASRRSTVGGEARVLYLAQATEDPDVAAISYGEAQGKLADALQNIKAIRLEQERLRGPEALAAAPEVPAGHPRLALDEFEHTDFTQRPHLMFDGHVTGPG